MRVKSRPKLVQSVTDSAHSTIVGGSTAKLRRLCNASIDEERKVPREPSGWAADRGTALHHVVETAVKGNWSNARVLREFAGTTYHAKDMAHEIELTRELLEAKALPALAFFDTVVHHEAEFWLEKKLPFPGIPGGFGTGDVFFDAMHVGGDSGGVDYKFGDGVVVRAEDNDQGRFYLCCGIAAGLLPDRDEYVFHIFQPAERLKPEQYHSVGRYTRADLDRFARDLKLSIDDWRSGVVAHNVGSHCEWCKGRIGCRPYLKELATAVASDIDGLSTAELARMMKLRKGIKQWADDVYTACLRNAQQGRKIPGYHLEPAEGNSVYKDAESAHNALTRLGMPKNIREVKELISPAQALLWMKQTGTPEAQIERFKTTHIRRPDKGEKLVEGEDDSQDFGKLLRNFKEKTGKR